MAKYGENSMSTSTFKFKQCEVGPPVIVVCGHNFGCINVHAKPFYVHKNQCMLMLNLSRRE